MAIGSNFLNGSVNLLQVAALRLPVFAASLTGAALVTEGAYRATKAALSSIGFEGNNRVFTLLGKGVDYIRPYSKEKDLELCKKAIICCAAGIIGNAVVTALFGEPRPIYNQVLAFMGPIRVSNDIHPLFQFISKKMF